MKLKSTELLIPKITDLRCQIMLFLVCFVIYAVTSPGFTRTPEQFMVAIFTCLSLDALLILLFKGVLLFPMSGIISSFGVLLLTDSPTLWAYGLVAALAILSKHFLTVDGRHIFNPNNFGVVVATLFFSDHITTAAGRWGGAIEGAIFIACFGTYIAYKANRLVLTGGYVSFFLLGAWIRSMILDRPFTAIAGPATGAAFQLFIFYMITDPMTSPSSKKGQFYFCLALASLDAVMRFYQVKNAPFYSLFFLTAVYSCFRAYYQPGHHPRPWSIKRIQLESTAS